MIELKRRVTPVIDVSEVFRFKGAPLVDIETSFAGVNNDLRLMWSSGNSNGVGKTATFVLPAAASTALSAAEDVSGNATITLASDAARVTTEGGSTWTVTDEGDNTWRFTEDTSWALNTTVVGDVVNITGFDGVNNGTFRVKTVNDGSHYIEISSTDGLAEATISGTIAIYPLLTASNTGTLVGSDIDGLASWSSENKDDNDGSGSVSTATPDFTTAGANSNEEVYTLASRQATVAITATVDGAVGIKIGTKYLLKNVTSTLRVRLSEGGSESAISSDIPIFANDSIVFYSDNFNTLHADGTTGVLIELAE